MLSKTTVHHFAGSNVALGTAAGKLFRVGCVIHSFFYSPYIANMDLLYSVMTISDQGDSDLLTIAEAICA